MWYKLEGDNVVKAETYELERLESQRRQNITQVVIRGIKKPWIVTRVSTVFLGMDQGRYSDEDKPVVFETMAFVDDNELELDKGEYLMRMSDQEIQVRYSSIDDAREGHETIVEHVRKELIKKKMGEVIRTDIHISL